MKRQAFFLLLLLCSWFTGGDMALAENRTKIEIKLDAHRYSLGGPIPLYVLYKNSARDVVFKQPEKAWVTKLAVKRSAQKETEIVPIGRVRVYQNEKGVVRKVVEPFKNIELHANEEYSFVLDIGYRWPDLLVPGHYALFIKDESDAWEGISNTLEIDVVFTQDSIDVLLEILADDKSEGEAKSFVTRILQEFNPSFGYDLSQPLEYLPNAQKVKEFMEWWAASKSNEFVLKKIGEMNQRQWEWP